MNVLYLGGFELPDKNAAAQRVVANAKLLREMRFEVTLIGVSKDTDETPSGIDGFRSEAIPYPNSMKEWLYHILTFVPQERIASYHPDYVILYNFPAIASLKIISYCHRHGIKVIHDTTEWEYAEGHSPRDLIKNIDTWLRMKYCLKKMDGVIAISRYLYDYYGSNVKTIQIPPMVDLADEKWDRDRVLTAEKRIKIVYAGSAGAKCKDRLDYVISVVSKNPDIEFVVVGMTQEQYIESFGKLPNDCDNISFKGRIPHQEAVNAVCDADFQMLIREDSLKNRAGFPTKFVESMSCCTPVIATLTSNIADYLADGENGFIVDKDRPLEKVLETCSKLSIEERIKMKNNCKNINFDYHTFQQEFEKIFS